MEIKIEVDDKPKSVSCQILCSACLCVGRTLHNISEEKIVKYYTNILDEIPLCRITSTNVIVCWECKSFLEKCVAFRERVKDSYRILQTYTNENLNASLLSDVSRPSRLTACTTESIDIKPVEQNAEESLVLVDIKKEEGNEWDQNGDENNTPPEQSPLSECSDDIQEFETELQTIINSMEEKKKNRDEKRTKKKPKKIGKSSQEQKKPKKGQKIITIELTFEEMLLEREKEATRPAYINAKYKCETCLIGFRYSQSYQAHKARRHSPDLGDYSCPICKTIISSVDAFTAHYKRHMRRYECSLCQKRTLDMKVIQQHYNSTHEMALKKYDCNLCGHVAKSIDRHRYHKDTHKARVECPECDKTFRHRAGLMNHRLTVHEHRSSFPCTVCDKVFRWKTSLKRHLQKHDVKLANGESYCVTCDVSFATSGSYQRHLKISLKHVTEDQLRFICDHCSRRFTDKTKLRNHIEEKHLHQTYKCQICLKPSKSSFALDQHMRNVHKGRPNNKMCHHCGKGFPTKVQLESHIRTHTGERPFICEFCPTTFSQQSNLYKHNRQVHMNIKSKRNSLSKKRKEDKEPRDPAPADPSQGQEVNDPYRPVAVFHYSPERGFVM